MPDWALNFLMIDWVMAWELPGWFDQKEMVLAGVTPSKLGPPVAPAEAEPAAEVVEGPEQADSSAAPAPSPARPSRLRREMAALDTS